MKFAKEDLQDEIGETILDEITDTTRWSVLRRRVFAFEGKCYETNYSHGATEIQDERPYEYDPEIIECKEVFPTEVTTVIYK